MTVLSTRSIVVPVEQTQTVRFILHDVTWTLAPGGIMRGKMTCPGQVGDQCRLECAEHCSATQRPCGPANARHAMVDSGRCIVSEHVGMSLLENSYMGDETHGLCNSKVEVSRQGNSYGWNFPNLVSPLRYVVTYVSTGMTGQAARLLLGDDAGPFDSEKQAREHLNQIASQNLDLPYNTHYEVRAVRYQVTRWELA